MSIKSFKSPFTQSVLGVIPISTGNGVAVLLDAPGTYVLSALLPWSHAESDGVETDDEEGSTEVDAGVDETVEITDTPVTLYLKLAPELRGHTVDVTVKYTQIVPDLS